MGLPCWLSGKGITCQCRRLESNPWVGKIPWRRKWQPIPIFLPGKSHGQRSLAGYSLWGHKELDMTKRLALTFQSFFMNSHHRRRGLTTSLFKVCWDTETRTNESQAVWAKGSLVGVSESTREPALNGLRQAACTELSQPQGGACSERRLGDRAALRESEGTCHDRDRCGGSQPRHKSK